MNDHRGIPGPPDRRIPRLTAVLSLLLAVGLAAGPVSARTFGNPQNQTTVVGPRSVAYGDLNGDGIQDMVAGGLSGSGYSVMRGLGGGAFAATLSYQAVGMGKLILVDLNGDGNLDLAAPNPLSNQISIFTGNGDCTFAMSKTFSAPPHAEFLVAADLNFDGKLDLATAGYYTNSTGVAHVYLNTTPPGGVLAFSHAEYPCGAQPHGIETGYVTSFGNPHLDLVTANTAAGTISILQNDGAGHFNTRTDLPAKLSVFAVTTASLYPGSRQQIVTTNRDSSSVSLFNYNDGTSTWNRSDIPTAAGPRDVVIADADDDLGVDVVVANYTAGKVSILTPNGFGGAPLLTKLDVAVGTSPHTVAVVDFDGDGTSELLTANFGGAQVRLSHAIPTVGWAPGDTIPSFSTPDQSGGTFQSSSLNGKWTLLDLCSRWCVPCLNMATHTDAVYGRWQGHLNAPFEYVTGLIDGATEFTPSTLADAQWWGSQFHIKRPVLHSAGSTSGGVYSVAKQSWLIGTPTVRLIDPQGRVVWIGNSSPEALLNDAISNATGVPIPDPPASPSISSGLETVTYGAQVITCPYDDLGGPMFSFFRHNQGWGSNLESDLAIQRWSDGTEDWTLYLTWQSYLDAPALNMPTQSPWQVTLSDLELDPLVRTLQGGVAALATVDTFGVSHDLGTTIPVTWSGGTLTLGAVDPAVLAGTPPIRRLEFAMTFQTSPVPTGVADGPSAASLELHSAWPNPARSASTLAWSNAQAGVARLDVYDVSGRLVRTLADGVSPAGVHTTSWNLADANGARVGAGIYFARLSVAGAGTRTQRIAVIR